MRACWRCSPSGGSCPRSGCPTHRSAPNASWHGSGCISSSTARRSRTGSTRGLISFGTPCPVTDLFGIAGCDLVQRLDLAEPWRQTVDAALHMIDEIDLQIAELGNELRSAGADHRYVPLLLTVPGIGWVLAYTIAAEIGEIERFASPNKLTGYTGLCPRVIQSGDQDRRGPSTKHGPKYLRWALLEATMHALRHPAYSERYQRNQAPARQAARRQGRPDRGGKTLDPRDLAHAHEQRTLRRCCSGRRRFSSGGLTAL